MRDSPVVSVVSALEETNYLDSGLRSVEAPGPAVPVETLVVDWRTDY